MMPRRKLIRAALASMAIFLLVPACGRAQSTLLAPAPFSLPLPTPSCTPSPEPSLGTAAFKPSPQPSQAPSNPPLLPVPTVPPAPPKCSRSAAPIPSLYDPGDSAHQAWMADMADEIGDLPLNRLALAGSHDAGTYSLAPDADLVPDGNLPGALLSLRSKLPLKSLNKVVANWSRNQGQDVYAQLKGGIRYLDLRVARRDNGQMYITHSVYGENLDTILSDVARFASEYPKEVVILHFQHVYQMNPAAHKELIGNLVQRFGSKLATSCQPGQGEGNCQAFHHSLRHLWNKGQQIVTLYTAWDELDTQDRSYAWPDSAVFSPWADKEDTGELFASLKKDAMTARNHPQHTNKLFVLQAILSPDLGSYLKGAFASLLPGPLRPRCTPSTIKELAERSAPVIETWVRALPPEQINIVMADWVLDYYRLVPFLRAINARKACGERPPDLAGLDLSQGDFSYDCFKGADLSGTSFAGADLSGANLEGATVDEKTDLRGANLKGANLRGVDLKRALRDSRTRY